jgi:hypothetical protein
MSVREQLNELTAALPDYKLAYVLAYVQGLMGGKNAILFICSFVGVNAVFEMCASTFLTGAVGLALIKAKVIPVYQKAESAA